MFLVSLLKQAPNFSFLTTSCVCVSEWVRDREVEVINYRLDHKWKVKQYIQDSVCIHFELITNFMCACIFYEKESC